MTGKVAFDQFGDTTTKVLTVYKVEKAPRAPSRKPQADGGIQVEPVERQT